MVLGADAVNAVRAVLASVDDNPVTQSEVCLELLRYTLRVDPGKTQPIWHQSSVFTCSFDILEAKRLSSSSEQLIPGMDHHMRCATY